MDPKRMAAALQFERTPDNPAADPSLAVALDCEMGYTTRGIEMIRLSATAWPSGAKLLDALVRPVGHVLDLNTRFSGVTAEQFLTAAPHPTTPPPASSSASAPPPPLRILPSPAAARALLCTLIAPATPLLGHALDNDLNVLRLVHGTLVDTALVFPHPGGLPYRRALRHLARDVLGRDVQTAGAAGHDSTEDALVAGELVRAAVAREWAVLRAAGWRVCGDDFVPPPGDKEALLKAERPVGRHLRPAKGWWVRTGRPADPG
jgi:hypothetical protein